MIGHAKKYTSKLRRSFSKFFLASFWKDQGDLRHSRFGIASVVAFFGVMLLGGVVRDIQGQTWLSVGLVLLGASVLDTVVVTFKYSFMAEKVSAWYRSKTEKSKPVSDPPASPVSSTPDSLRFTMTKDGPRFRLAYRNGYESSGVDDLIGRLEALPSTLEGYRAAYDLVSSARFRLARRNGYDPAGVDDYFDWKLAELSTSLKVEDSTSPTSINALDAPGPLRDRPVEINNLDGSGPRLGRQ